jgi:GDSL-like Lipase/Acylhydrolase family/N-terminus of Esterase_SGNH_hydro-type
MLMSLMHFSHSLKSFKSQALIIAFSLFLSPSFAMAQTLNSPLSSTRADGSNSWFDIRQLDVEGRGWNDTKAFYDRLPAKAEGVVRKPVWDLSRNSAGIYVRFVTDATSIRARWALTDPWLYQPNATAICVSGLDLYVKTEKGWHWLAVGAPEKQTNDVMLIKGLIPGKREYILYLPLYNGTKFVELGIPTNAVIEKAGPWGPGIRKPVVFYGTSILQGLSASRPGMVHNAILGRQFNWPTINLGFSGNGKMEPEMADLLAELDPSVYVIDCLPNTVADEIKVRAEPLVRKLRAAHPNTPIVLVEDRTLQNAFLVSGQMEYYHLKDRAELKAAYGRLQDSGIKDLYYIPGEHLFGDDGEGTVDGSHPTDLGFTRQAEIFAKVLEPLLKSP